MEIELKIKALSSVVNRHKSQTEFLLKLCDNDFEKLLLLEQKIKENYIFFCPGSKSEINKILEMPHKENSADIIKDYMLKLLKINSDIR